MKAGRAWKVEQSRIQSPVSAATGASPFPPAVPCHQSPSAEYQPAAPPQAAPGLIVCTVQPRGARGAAQATPTPTHRRPPDRAQPGAWPARTPPRAAAVRPESHAGRRENGDVSASRAPRSLHSPTSRTRRRSTHRGSPSALPEPRARQQLLEPSSRRCRLSRRDAPLRNAESARSSSGAHSVTD